MQTLFLGNAYITEFFSFAKYNVPGIVLSIFIFHFFPQCLFFSKNSFFEVIGNLRKEHVNFVFSLY